MPYDEELADRLREALAVADAGAVTERRMFGGLAFLVGGHLALAASHTGGLLARVDPAASDALLARPHVAPMEMRGRTMEGWLRVEPEGFADDAALTDWVDRSLAYVRTLPPKG